MKEPFLTVSLSATQRETVETVGFGMDYVCTGLKLGVNERVTSPN